MRPMDVRCISYVIHRMMVSFSLAARIFLIIIMQQPNALRILYGRRKAALPRTQTIWTRIILVLCAIEREDPRSELESDDLLDDGVEEDERLCALERARDVLAGPGQRIENPRVL